MNDAYAYVCATDVIIACKALISCKLDESYSLKQELIYKEMSKRFFKAKTEEIAIKRIEDRCFGMTPWRWELVGDYDRAHTLSRLATTALQCGDGKILLGAKDNAILSKYLPKKTERDKSL